MAENSKRKPRKSKLVLRECDFDDDRKDETKNPKSALSNILSKIDKNTSPEKSNIEVSVSVEIERDTQDEYTNANLPYRKPERRIFTECLLPEDILKEETMKVVESSTSTPDKIIEIEIRNNWGKFVQPGEEQNDEYESMIQTALCSFKQWNYQSRVRESILAYKCYICNIGWWQLTHFRAHIKQHKDVKVNIEPSHHECYIVAFYSEQGLMRAVQIDGVCRYCLRASSEHEFMKRNIMSYFCEGCHGRFFTCAALFNHEGTCGRFQKILLQNNILNDYSTCQICKTNCLTQNRFEQHLILRHSVYSDEPLSYFWPATRACQKCSLKFFIYCIHICPKKFENISCAHCYRKFQHAWMLDIHLATNNSTINCRICNKDIKQCSETEHMLKHTDTYKLAYKCQRCERNILFPNDHSARKHCELQHYSRCEMKMKGFLLVLVPRQILLDHSHLMDLSVKVRNEPAKSTEQPIIPELVPIKSRPIKLPQPNVAKSKTGLVKPIVNNQMKNLEGACSKSIQDQNRKIITRENVQEYLLKDLMEQEKALDEETTLEHDKKILDHDYIRNSFGCNNAEYMIDDIKQEPKDQSRSDLLKVIKKENIDQDYLNQDKKDITVKQDKDNLHNVRIKTEPLDNILLYPDYNMTNIAVKEEKFENDLSNVFQVSKNIANVFQASTRITGEVQEFVKEEPMDDFDYEDDIIMLSNENFTIVEHPLIKSNEDCSREDSSAKIQSNEFQEDLSKFEPEIIVTNQSPSKMIESDLKIAAKKQSKIFSSDIKIVSNRILLKTNDDKTKKERTPKGARWYKCNKCNYQNILREFKKHTTQCRQTQKYTKITNEDESELAKESLWDQYYCTKCNCIFFTLKKYILHFISHNVKQGSCPVCAINLPNVTHLGMHFISHVKQSYVKDVQSLKANEELKKKNEQLVTEHEELMKKNDDLIKSNKKVINKNEKIINDNEKLMYNELSMEEDIDLLKQNEQLFIANEKLATHNVALNSQNEELRLKIDECNAIWRGIGKCSMYKCKDCQEKVLLRDSFRHFESHLILEPATSKPDNDELINRKNEIVDASILSPEIIQKIVDILKAPKASFYHSLLKKCVVCERTFDRRNDSKRHLIEHMLRDAYASLHEHRALQCQLCHMMFDKSGLYKQHMRDHAGLPLYKCELCDKSFSDSSNFAKHKKVHNFEVLICDMCKKKFHSKHQIQKHMAIHLSTEPIQCIACNRVFYTPFQYKKHMRERHTRQKFICILCRERFETLKQKWDHMWEIHKQRKHKADCPVCDRSYRKFQDVRNHIKLEHKMDVTTLTLVNTKNCDASPSTAILKNAREVLETSSIDQQPKETLVVYDLP